MKSPFIVIVVALILAIVGYFTATFIEPSPLLVAIAIFAGAVISPFFVGDKEQNTAEGTQELKTLYVGNLPYRANEAAVRELFAEHGFVSSVRLMKDKQTGKRRGFGFVEMSADDVENAVNALNDTEFQQRTLKVREAKERPDMRAQDEE